jgi:hypothetical protein
VLGAGAWATIRLPLFWHFTLENDEILAEVGRIPAEPARSRRAAVMKVSNQPVRKVTDLASLLVPARGKRKEPDGR